MEPTRRLYRSRKNRRATPNAAQQRVVRNGLLAFAVFQARGNEPARFTRKVCSTP